MTKFINPANIVAQVGLLPGSVVADFGCGAGYFTIPAGQMVGSDGQVYAVDIMHDRLEVTQSSARQAGLKNISVLCADLARPIVGIDEAACDVVVVSNILHQMSSKEPLLINIYKVLKTGGKVLAVEWKKEYTPLGPEQDLRISRDALVEVFTKKGFRLEKDLEADGYHYALLFIK